MGSTPQYRAIWRLHLLLQQGHHRGLRTEGADHLGGDTRLTHRQDGIGANVLGGGAGGVGRWRR